MKLDEYALDDLHVCALAEFEHDDEAQKLLNAAYRTARASYIKTYQQLRGLPETEAL